MKHLDFLIAQMVRVTQENGLLTHYSEDLTKHDRRMFELMEGWSAFGWVVSPTSSDVYPLGLHHKYHADLLHVARLRVPSGAKLFWVNPERARHDGSNVLVEVSLEGFERGVKTTKCYSYDNGRILTPSGAPAASLKLEAMHCGLSGTTTILMDQAPLLPNFRRSWGDQFALAQAVEKHGPWTRVFERAHWEADQARRRGEGRKAA